MVIFTTSSFAPLPWLFPGEIVSWLNCHFFENLSKACDEKWDPLLDTSVFVVPLRAKCDFMHSITDSDASLSSLLISKKLLTL